MNTGLPAFGGGPDGPAVNRHPPAHAGYPRLAERRTIHGKELRVRKPNRRPSSQRMKRIADDEPAPDLGEVDLDQPQETRVEAHHAERTSVPGNGLLQRRRPPPEIAIDLGFKQQRDAAADQREQTFESRNGMFADAQPRQRAPVALANPEWTSAHSERARIVKDDHPIVDGQPEIALDPAAELERGDEGGQAVLGKSGAGVQAPVRESGRSGIERVRL